MLQPKVSLSAEVNVFNVFGFTVVAGVGTELGMVDTLTELLSRGWGCHRALCVLALPSKLVLAPS